jgi:anthranilate phosphoribosyltransferase
MNPVEMKRILDLIYSGETFSEQQSYELMMQIGNGAFNEIQVAAFLSALNMRAVTVNELKGMRRAMLDLCIPVNLQDYDAMDLCGTGGDGKDTFNISTLSAFVVAGAGVPVAKHGNYAVSSHCGSSNVLEYFGLKFTNDLSIIYQQMEKANITILHAPLFHPAMKYVAPARKAMQVKTIFNILGPLSNPSQPKVQVSGVYSMDIARLYHFLMQKLHDRYAIVHSLDGYDEISLTGVVKIYSHTGEKTYSPQDMGFQVVQPIDLSGGLTIQEAAAIFLSVLECTSTDIQREVVVANAAVAISIHQGLSLSEAKSAAEESLDSKKALRAFQQLLSIQP